MGNTQPMGVGKLYFFSTAEWAAISDTSAIDTTELATGTDVTGAPEAEHLATLAGFKNQTSSIEMAGMGSRQVPSIPGRITKGTGTVGFWYDDTTQTIFDLFADNTDGALLWAPAGITAGDNYEAQTIKVMDRSFDPPADNAATSFTVEVSQGITIKGTLTAP